MSSHLPMGYWVAGEPTLLAVANVSEQLETLFGALGGAWRVERAPTDEQLLLEAIDRLAPIVLLERDAGGSAELSARLLGVVPDATIVTVIDESIGRVGAQPESHLLLTLPASPDVFIETLTAAVRQRDRLVATRKALEATRLEFGAFVSSVNHEIRGDMTSVIGVASMLAEIEAEQLSDSGKEQIERVVDAAEGIVGKISGLVKLARVDRQEPHREPVDLTALLGEVVAVMRFEDPGRDLDLGSEGDLPRIELDGNHVRAIIEELLENAAKFNGKPLPVIRVSWTPGELGGSLEEGGTLTVWDDGAGVPDSAYESIFSAFQKYHGRGTEGVGLGLTLVRRLAGLHGGRAWAEVPGRGGMAFHVYLRDAVTL